MTEILFLEDSYCKQCTANVKSISNNSVVLDQTIFYPRGGGQPSDQGTITHSDGTEYKVLNVIKRDGQINHELDRTGLSVGDSVICKLDWSRRYRLMQMHTAAHVLAATMCKHANSLITGNQLEVEKTRFDFKMQDFDRTKFEEIVKFANTELEKDIELKIFPLPREEAMKIPDIVKLAGALPPSISVLRIVEIPGIDIQADGGTHVKNLKEVGKIEILKLENKGKDNRRIYFTLI
ncbi:alanyl-tRNA editing protein [Candidatus Micrarchaeota archaeon]|nr:alanyl-tRNA editing protein [Candidatus Micrarchaeota archaeon]MBU1682208.1 alanyl-tRNA editing protein [Candidatus Micrarchaeota archaeon]